MTAYDEEKHHDSERSDSADHTEDHYSEEHSTGHHESNKPGMDTGSIILIVLVVLAIIASIVMLIASSTAALKIALLAALWAAVGGIFLVSRYRNQVKDREDEMYVREDLYHAEMEKLRAQQETSKVIERLENSSDIDMDVLAEIKAELASIREQLEELSGREFTYEPAALQAEARRILEIEARAKAAKANAFSYTSDYDSDLGAEPEYTPAGLNQPSAGKPSADAIAGRIGNTPTYSRQDNPLAEFINEMNSESTTAETSPVESKAEPEPEVKPAAEKKKKKSKSKPAQDKPQKFNTGSFQAVRWDAGGDEAAKPAAKHASPAEDDEEARGGRRRSDAKREGSVSVAELLAAAKKRNKES